MKNSRRLKSSKILGKYMADYYYDLDKTYKSGMKKIAWCSSVGPAEILRAMGFTVYFPETHAAMLGASRMATDLIPIANSVGYSPEICSYLTSDIGSYLKKISPLSKVFPGVDGPPKPDILVFNTNQCRDVKDWFSFYSREYNVPVIGVHSFVGVGELNKSYITAISNQMRELVPVLEEISNVKFDLDKLKNVVSLSKKCSELWKNVLDMASEKPSPITFFDATTLMGPAVVGRGTESAVECYTLLLDELKERVENSFPAVENEKYRIYWDGMPVWGRLSSHASMFSSLNVNVLASTYCNSWIFSDLDFEDPFMSMAKAYTNLFIVRSDDFKEEYIANMLKFFRIDGIIFHDSKTCSNNSNSRYGMPKRLQELTGITSLVINGDLNDLRLISDEQTRIKVEAFIEQLEENL